MLPSTWQQQHTLTSWQHMQQHLPPCPRHCSRRGLQQSPLQSSLKDAAASQQSYHAAAQRCSRQPHAHVLRAAVRTGAAGISNCATSTCRGTCCCNIQQPMLLQQQQALLQLGASRQRRQRPTHIAQAANQSAPDPWQRPPSPGGAAATTDWGGGGGGSGNGSSRRPPGGYGGPMGGNGSQSPTASYDAWDAAARPPAPGNGVPRYEQTDWGWSGTPEDWDPAAGLAPEQLADMERDYMDQLQRRRASQDPPRDKWITPLLDWQSISGAFDPDQSRTEDAMADEALTNKEESREALSFIGRLVVTPLITGALISRAITDPVLSFSLQNNPNAFALSEHQKLEGAQALHMEETRVKMMMAIGQIPPLNEAGMLEHLHEFALEFQEEEREKNEASLMTLVSDSISAMVFFIMFVRDNDARQALFSTIGRLFEGLSDIAKAVLIILVADTLLGYHSEEGWTGFLDLFLGHYGIEVEEENIVLFVGIIPIAIDVLFKYWIFIGLNKISPGAVVTIKQLDRH